MAVIEIKKLDFSYVENQMVLKHIDLSIEKNEKVGLIGSNGVGKSTLLKILVGILSMDESSISVCDMSLNKKNLKEIRRQVGYIFQDSDSQLFMPTVYADVSFGAKNYGYSNEEVKIRTMNALKQVQLDGISDKQIYHLSGGEKKLVSIAGILTLDPQIILMDEPSASLDPKNRRNLIQILNDLDCAYFIASHDLDFIYDTCDRVILLHHGQIVADGNTKEVLKNKELLEQCDLELPLRFQEW